MLPLGFRSDVDAVLLRDVAHRRDCELLPRPLPQDALAISADEVYRAQRCPRECAGCRPSFETMLSYRVESSICPKNRVRARR